MVYLLSSDKNISPYIHTTWETKEDDPLRGLKDDAGENGKTAALKVVELEMMLQLIAVYAPIISRRTIIEDSVSLDSVWCEIREHYGFLTTGSRWLDVEEFKLKPEERPQDLYQRLSSFVDDNLLRKDGKITHKGKAVQKDEMRTPTVDNWVMSHWLYLVNPKLPALIKSQYSVQLKSLTLASLKSDIFASLDSLLCQIQAADDVKAYRTTFIDRPAQPYRQSKQHTPNVPIRKPLGKASCSICLKAGLPAGHFLSSCRFLSDNDKRFMMYARALEIDEDAFEYEECLYGTEQLGTKHIECGSEGHINRVDVCPSATFDGFVHGKPVSLLLDTGATGNIIHLATAKQLGLNVIPAVQGASQSDGKTPLDIVGEIHFSDTRDNASYAFDGLVAKELDPPIIAGNPFLERHNVMIAPAKRQITMAPGKTYSYGAETHEPQGSVRRCSVLQAPSVPTTVYPGESIDLTLPEDIRNGTELALEPRGPHSDSWPSPKTVVKENKVSILNSTSDPQTLKRYEHFCQVRPLYITKESEDGTTTLPTTSQSMPADLELIRIDPDELLKPTMVKEFKDSISEFSTVFEDVREGYNGVYGPFQARVNIGPTQPPQHKGRLPYYARGNMDLLQRKLDDLENMGVLKRLEDIGIDVEYVNTSFLVAKQNGGHRLVTDFSDVGRYSKPQPSLLSNVDATLRQIARWKYLASTDLSSAFHQIPLHSSAQKYCGICTPFKGIRVYVRSAMGMPGSETALEELLCRVIGHLIQEGVVAKLADDLYCGGSSPEDLLHNWRRLLLAFSKSNLKLSPAKTVVCPKSTTLLGWLWEEGTIAATPHRISTLSSCVPPSTVKGMRSFVGAYKTLARVLPTCARLVYPLEASIAGAKSTDKLKWCDNLSSAFTQAQKSLQNTRVITLPKPEDELWVITDAAVREPGIGSTLYVVRDGKLHAAGFFSAKLKPGQAKWLPCEVEALAIAISIRHFSPFIIQSKHKARVLTDSKPCVQAWEKLCRGEFSASPRVMTFLSTASRYQISLQHLAGSSNPVADFASRNAPPCTAPNCQICQFVNHMENATVMTMNISEILKGTTPMPYMTRSTWLEAQSECKDLRRTRAHLLQGTRPSKKLTNIRDVKRYLRVASVARDGLVYVPLNEPFSSARQCIVVPRSISSGLLTAMHLKLDHPSAYQLKQVIRRFFFILDLDRHIEEITESCHQCASLRPVKHLLVDQSSEPPVAGVGVAFAADVLRRARQMIMVVRETITSYTCTQLIDDEKQASHRSSLLCLCMPLQPLQGPPSVIRTDCAPAFKSLVNDAQLRNQNLCIELGRAINVNKNPVAECAIQELEAEISRLDPTCNPLSASLLAIATANLNHRIRKPGLSARELVFQRDQYSNDNLNVDDSQLISYQHQTRQDSHIPSASSKTPRANRAPSCDATVGDIVYLREGKTKHHPRDRFLVVSKEGKWFYIRKFVGSQLRHSPYKVKSEEVFCVPDYSAPRGSYNSCRDVDSDRESDVSDSSVLSCEGEVEPRDSALVSAEEKADPIEDVTLENDLNVLYLPPAVPDATESTIEYTEYESPPAEDAVPPCDQPRPVPIATRPSRKRSVPAWHKDYDFGK